MGWIRSRLLVLVVLILLLTAVTPLVVLAVIGLRSFEENSSKDISTASELLEKRTLDALETRASDMAYDLAFFLRQREYDLQELAKLPVDSEVYLNFARSQTGELWTLNLTGQDVHYPLPIYREVTFINPDGQERVRVQTRCTPYPWYCDLEISRNLFNASDPTQTAPFIRSPHDDYFQQAQRLKEGEIYVSRPIGYYVPPTISYKSAQQPTGQRFQGVIRFIMPVHAPTPPRQLLGYVMLALDHTHVMEFTAHVDPTATRPIALIDPGPDNLAYIVGSDGAAIAHIVHSNIAGLDPDGAPVPFLSRDNPLGPGNFYSMGFINEVFPELMSRAAIQPQGVVPRYEVRDLARSMGYAVIPFNTGLNYKERGFGIVILSTNYDSLRLDNNVFTQRLNAELFEVSTQFGSLVAITLAAVGLVTFYVARRVVRPIQSVTNVAQAIEEGQLTEEAIIDLKNTRGQNEVALLSRTFGTMAEKVRSREQQIAVLLAQTDDALTRRVKELSVLGEIGQGMTSTLALDDVLKFGTTALLQNTHTRAVQLMIYQTKDDPLRSYSAGDSNITANESTFITNIPLELEGRSIGQFTLFTRRSGLDEGERVFARQLAGWLAIAIENAQLFERIDEQRRQLETANYQIKETSRLKSEFLSTMSHELRTPLNAIIGFCGIMLEGMGGEVDEDARGMLERIEANSKRLLALINDILDIAKIEAGRLELVAQPFSPRALAEQWQAQMNVLAEQKNLYFDVIIDDDLPQTLYGDEGRITQIAVNLLSNAFKFTETGGVQLVLDWHERAWLIQVIDTGAGIPEDLQTVIFDEFRQVDASTKRSHGGTGLGLAIVRNLCTLMRGSVGVTSEMGVGSVFTVTLPLPTEDPHKDMVVTAEQN